jgi:hypothetical protein
MKLLLIYNIIFLYKFLFIYIITKSKASLFNDETDLIGVRKGNFLLTFIRVFIYIIWSIWLTKRIFSNIIIYIYMKFLIFLYFY